MLEGADLGNQAERPNTAGDALTVPPLALAGVIGNQI
jgi:hypothetical protein